MSEKPQEKKVWERFPVGMKMTIVHSNGMQCPGEIKEWELNGEMFRFKDIYGRDEWLPKRRLE